MLWTLSFLFLFGECLSYGLKSSDLKSCGEILCKVYEYCSSDVDHQCHLCSTICDTKSRNYDENTCDQFCQDYIHDYIRHYIKKGELSKLEARIDHLNNLVAISLLIGIILCMISLLGGVYVWIRYRKYFMPNKIGDDDYYKKKLSVMQYITRHNNNNGIGGGDNNLPQITTVSTSTETRNDQLNVRIPPDNHHHNHNGGSQSPSPPSTNNTTVSHLPRYPSEDATLEYAYDNPAMTPTPPARDRF